MKNLILAALTATTLAAPAKAQANDIGLVILGIIAGAVITDNQRSEPEPNLHNHRPAHQHRQPDRNKVCGYRTEYQRNWIITTGTNCKGEVVSMERRRK